MMDNKGGKERVQQHGLHTTAKDGLNSTSGILNLSAPISIVLDHTKWRVYSNVKINESNFIILTEREHMITKRIE